MVAGNIPLNKPSTISSLLKNEDWWAFGLGFLAIILGITGIITKVPAVGGWTNVASAITLKLLLSYVLVGLGILVLTSVVIKSKGESLRQFIVAFPAVFVLAFLAIFVSKYDFIGKSWGLEYAIWALVIGLLISNTIGTPVWLRAAVKTELYIKIGLVLMGAGILFQQILQVGPPALLQTVLVISAVFFFAYFLGIKFGLTKTLASVMASAVSICGVSAAIAAGGASKAHPKEISYTASIVLIVAVPLLVLMPIVARLLGFPDGVAGAWIGGVIDTTPAVAAAGSMLGPAALKIAVVVKMAQNLFIGVAALLLALFVALKTDGNASDKPGLSQLWYRFPKFILGFILASVLFSLVLMPTIGSDATNAIIKGVTEPLRGWFFALAFVCIGLDTRVRDIVTMGKGKPFLVFLAAQGFNIFWTLGIAYLVFGRVA